MHQFKIIIGLFLLFLPGINFGQKKKKEKPVRITFSGIVTDENKEPLPFVNIYFKPEKKGTTTDINGEFILNVHRKRGKLIFSLTGYETKIIKINPKKTFLRIVLKEQKNVLNEVVIVRRPKKRLKKKENPAYRILKEIWKRKKKNGLKQVPRYSYKKYETTEIGLNRVDSVFLKKIFKKDYQKILKELPFDSEGFNYYIPIYIKETVFDIYGDNERNKYLEKIEAENSKGFYSQGFVFDRMANKFDEVDIYKNTFNLLNKPFVSPISSTGFDTYDYLLYDSIQKNNKKFYNIYFFPRRPQDLAFEGNFLVSGDNFAVTKIDMELKKDVNVNFVRGVSISKEYTIVNDSIYLPKSDIFVGDFTLLDKNDKNKGINIKKSYYYSDYEFTKKYPDEFFEQKVIKVRPHQFAKDSLYWKRYSNLTQSKNTYRLIDKVKNKKRVQRITKWINLITTGYIDIGKYLQFGPVFQTIGKNGVEGFRLSAGFRTFKSSDDRFRLIGHLAYGTDDETFKYGLQVKYLLSYQPRIEIAATVLDDYVQQARNLMDVSQIMFVENFGANFVLSRGKNVFLSHIQKRSLKIDYRIAKNFHTGIIPTYRLIEPADRRFFNMDYVDRNNRIKKWVLDVGSSFYLAYTPGRDVYGYGVEQRYGKNPYPSFIINYYRGFRDLGGDFNYSKLQFRYMQRVLLGKIGKTDLTLEIGKTFGKVPLALLNPIPANQILLLKPNTFSLLNYYDFVTDTYVVGHFEHHFSGFILNRIPLIRKLKFRTVAAFRFAYGNISNENISINRSNILYAAPTNNIYYEYSIGLENIGYGNLRFIRVDAVWRSDYTSVNGLYSPEFAIRVGIRPDF